MTSHQPGGGLRKELGVPLYHQIQHLLRHRIHSGLYPPGTQIPSEHELSRELAVSRVTLREALRELVRENLLVKVQGKGTFVSSNPPKRLARVRYTGFLEELQERVRKLKVTDVEVAQAPATADLRAALQLDPATAELTRDPPPPPHRRRAVLLHAELPADRNRRADPARRISIRCRC